MSYTEKVRKNCKMSDRLTAGDKECTVKSNSFLSAFAQCCQSLNCRAERSKSKTATIADYLRDLDFLRVQRRGVILARMPQDETL